MSNSRGTAVVGRKGRNARRKPSDRTKPDRITAEIDRGKLKIGGTGKRVIPHVSIVIVAVVSIGAVVTIALAAIR